MSSCALRRTSVLYKYSSRRVPVRSCTYTQRTRTNPCPALYHQPTSLTTSTSRRPPPYQLTFKRWRFERATTSCGEGLLAPLTRGRPLPAYGGGASYRLASAGNLLTSASR